MIYSHTSTTIYRKILQTKLFSVLSGTMQKSKQCYISNNNNDYTEYDSRLEGITKLMTVIKGFSVTHYNNYYAWNLKLHVHLT